MKIGMNLLLWADHVTEALDGVLDEIKAVGFDAVEVPIFNTADRAAYERLGKRLGKEGVRTMALAAMDTTIVATAMLATMTAAIVVYLADMYFQLPVPPA